MAAAAADRHSVHVHTDDAGAAVAGMAVRGGEPYPHLGVVHRSGRPGGWSRQRAVLAVVDGDGAAELFAGGGRQRGAPGRRTDGTG